MSRGHSLDKGTPRGHHGAARLRSGRPVLGLPGHGGKLVAPGRRQSILEHLGWVGFNQSAT
jgi:hypothetical protein